MDKKIIELKELQELTGSEYAVVAEPSCGEDYKVKAELLAGKQIEVDEELSKTSKNPVENRAIAFELEQIKEDIGDIEDFLDNLDFDLAVDAIDTETVDSTQSASVEINDLGKSEDNVKRLSFNFRIPKGPQGEQGPQGIPGVQGEPGEMGSATRTVFAFKSSTSKPERPVGGSWNPDSNQITYPQGWQSSDSLTPPVWMSNATFGTKGIIVNWSDPIQITGQNGVNGEDGSKREYVYKLFKEEQTDLEAPYSDPYVDDYQVDGWIDHPSGIDAVWTCEYVCVREKDLETLLWGPFSKPALWSKYGIDGRDGDGIEYIYQRTKKENRPATPGYIAASHSPTSNYQDREFIPQSAANEEKWTDDPTGVDETYICEWVSVRKWGWASQQWGPFSEPALWAKYGADGEDGTGVTILGSFDSYEDLYEAWQNGTLPGNNPPQVGDAYLVNGDLWVFDGDDFYNCGQIQGPPGEKVYVHIKYANYLDSNGNGVFTSNNGETPGKYIGLRVDYDEYDSTNPADYVWSQFTGNDGFGYEYIFQRSEEFVAPDVPTTITASNVAPEGWTDDPTGVDETYKYEWACYRKSDENGDWSEWKGKHGNTSKAWLFAMFAESVPGKTGSQGPVLFPMGYWEEGTYKQIWNDEKNIATATPYVLYKGDNKHYVLMVEETNEEPGDGTDWQLMENFSALYTDILLADRATVGNACFYGNYMFSQEGNGELSSFDITTNNPYESEGFKPAWCVNLITGEMWAGTGTSYFGADGSGSIADGKINWDSSKTKLILGQSDSAENVAITPTALVVSDTETIQQMEGNITEGEFSSLTSGGLSVSHMDTSANYGTSVVSSGVRTTSILGTTEANFGAGSITVQKLSYIGSTDTYSTGFTDDAFMCKDETGYSGTITIGEQQLTFTGGILTSVS